MKSLILPIILSAAILTPLSSTADFNRAVKAYEAGKYEEASAEFQSLAEIGNKSAQYNLGMMYLDGLGSKQDLVKAYAWIKLSDEDGKSPDTQKTLNELKQHLKNEVKMANNVYSEIQKRFGHEAIIDELTPILSNEQAYSNVASPIKTIPAQYPIKAAISGKNGWVSFQFDLNEDGKPIDIEVLDSYPGKMFVKNSKRAIKQWQFKLPEGYLASNKKNAKMKYRMEFIIDKRVRAGSREDREMKASTQEKVKQGKETILEVKQKAESGDPVMQYYYAKFGKKLLNDASINPAEWYYKSAVQGVADSQYELALSLFDGAGCVQDKKKGVNWLLKAASADLPAAQLKLAKTYHLDDITDKKVMIWTDKAIESGLKLNQSQYDISRFIINDLENEDLAPKAVSLLNSLDKAPYVKNYDFYSIYAKAHAMSNDFPTAIEKLKVALDIHKDKFGAVSKSLKEQLVDYEAKL